MKVFTKYLLTLLLLGIASVVNASSPYLDDESTPVVGGNEVTIVAGDFEQVTSAEFSVYKDGVYVTCTSGTVTTEQIRVFKSQTITFSSEKDIKKISILCTEKGSAKYGPGCFNEQEGYTFKEDDWYGIWEGSANSVSFTAESNQVRINEIVITLEGESIIVTPELADGTYYIKNVASGNFFTGANNWGTQASVAPSGAPFEVTLLPEGGYSLKYLLSTADNTHLGSNLYVDSQTPDGGFAIEKNEDDTFVIKLDGKYLAEGTETGPTNDAIVVQTEELTAAAKWQFITIDEAVAAMKQTAPANATFLISNPNFNRNTSTAAWTVSADCTNRNLGGGGNGNFCAESWHSVFTISQVLANAPAGRYSLTAQGFYRPDVDPEEDAPVIFANDKSIAIPLKTGSENSMTDASNSFTAGLYTIEPIEFNVFEDGQLTIGVKGTSTSQWVIWDNFQLTYLSSEISADEFETAYQNALAAAIDALDNEDYSVVEGIERANLENAISKYGEVDDSAYEEAINALTSATNTFVAAVSAYLAFGDAQAQLAACQIMYPYASEEKLAAAKQVGLITIENAEQAEEMAVRLLMLCRQVAESSALLEGVEGSRVLTELIQNPNAEYGTDGWELILEDGTSGRVDILSNEPLTDGDGNSDYRYFDGLNWSSDYWNGTLQQEIALPAGRYLLTVSGRASSDVMMSVFAGEVEDMIFGEGATGGLYGKGWNDVSVEFELDEASNIYIGVRAEASTVHQWMSFTRFRLAKFGTPGEEDPELVAPEGWTNLITNGNLASDDVSSFISKVYPNVEDMFGATIAEGAGVNGSRGIVVSTPEAEEAETWDSQFWINLNRALPEGTILHVEFDYAASDYSWASTQAHGEPSVYHHWVCLGNVEFAQEWQHFSADIEVSEEMAKGANSDGIGLKSIAFNLNDDKKAVDYYFDNFGVWAQLPPYDTSVAIFDFNASDHATSSNDSNEGDIVEDETLEVDGVTLTVTPSGGNTPNRYWMMSYGPQLRMYGGTMTIEAPVGKAIKFVEFNSGKWNQGNIINGFESYEPYWEGNSTNVVLDVAGNTQFNSILVTVESSNSNTTTYQEIVWSDIVINGNIEDNNMECFYVTEQSVGGPFIVKPTKGAGVNGSRGIVVQSSDDAENDWDTQFFVRLPYQLPAGTPYRFSFDFKADKFAEFCTESHAEPSEYIWWEAFCNSTFDTEWQTYKCEGVITSNMSTYDNMMQTIAFDLALNREATKFVFDNIKFEIPTYVEENLELNPAVDPEYYPVIAPAIVESYPGNKTFNVWNGIMEFNVTFDKPVNCESIVATLNDEPLTVIPNEGVEETIFLARSSDTDLADGNYTIFLKNVYPAEDDVEGLSGEYSITFTVGPINLDPEAKAEVILADNLWDATEEGGIPEGYLVNFNGEERTSENQYGSGPRMFVFAEGGDFTHGLYFREGYTQYGGYEDYPLYLEAGKKYTINFKSAMWKDSGTTMNFQILSADEDYLVYEEVIKNNPNVNGSKAAVTDATNTTIAFTPQEDGNYILRWAVDGFNEVLLANPTVKYMTDDVNENVLAFFAALENAKQERDASADFMDNEEYGSLDYEINWAESEYQYFTNFNQFMEAAKELENVAYRMKEYRRLYQEYYPLAETMLALRQQYADTKFTQSYIYNYYLIRCIDNYAPYGEILDQYNLGSLSNAYSDIKYAVNMVQDMFTEGPSQVTMTGYAVLKERVRQGAETMRTLGIDNEDLLWDAENILDEEEWLVDEMKQSIKKDIYKKLSKADNTLFDPIIDVETGEEVTPAYNMNIYVENPNIYKWGYSDKDFSVPGWYVENANVSTGWVNYDSWEVPADAMFSNWGNFFEVAQSIGDLPAGTYTVKFAVGERQEDTYTDSKAYVYTGNEEYYADIDYIGQTFPEFSVNNGIVTIENVVVTDGWMQFGVLAESGSHLFFNEVQLLLTAPAPGYDYYDESEVLVGDVNLDGEVTTSDAVATVGLVLDDWQPSYRQFRAADVNYSYNITVSDVVGVVNIALNGYEWYRALARSQSMEQEINYLTQDANKIGLNNTTEFVAFQMDVTLADGAMLNGVNLNQRANGLNIRYSHLEGNTYRIMAFSMNMAAITGNEGELLSLDITGNQTVTLSNIEFTDTAARAYALGVNDATGINGIMAGDANADYYTVDGVKSNKMRKGMNVVKTADGKVRKMFVK